MGMSIQHYLLGLFAVANNVAAIPLFLLLIQGLTSKEHLKLRNIATLTAFLTMVMSLFMGIAILKFFEISLPAFRIAGGLLLLRMGISMMSASKEKYESEIGTSGFSKIISTAVIPIAIPLTTGPGTISTIILFASTISHNAGMHLLLLAAILIMTLVIWLSFWYGPVIAKVFGSTGLDVMTKIFGLITLALGVQFILTGISSTFPKLLD
ncbi:MAG TPA: antibiotic resistance protein MarC [Nitrospiraceae bacterium]|nr:antibiotic resistance protein MarC [Nitrospiraceae bacterium]